jgi:hypothetical protein
MNRQQIIHYQPQLKQLLYHLKNTTRALITVVIILYSLAVYCLLKEQMGVAASLATMAALLFHFSQKYTLSLITYWLSKNKKNSAMLTFVDNEIKKRKIDSNKSGNKKDNEVNAFFTVLEKALEIIDNE